MCPHKLFIHRLKYFLRCFAWSFGKIIDGLSLALTFLKKNWRRFYGLALSSAAKCYARTYFVGSVIKAWKPTRRVHWVLRPRLAPKKFLYRLGARWR
jgi:hypothetical protein